MAEEKAFTELFQDQIKDLYSAEKQIIQALPKMAKKTTNPDLRAAFEEHLEQTRDQAARLEQIAEDLDFSLRGKKCKGAEGLIEEGKEAMEQFDGEIRDAALIGAAGLAGSACGPTSAGCFASGPQAVSSARIPNVRKRSYGFRRPATRMWPRRGRTTSSSTTRACAPPISPRCSGVNCSTW